MNFLSTLFGSSGKTFRVSFDTQLRGQHLVLRAGDPADWHQWRTLRDMSRDFLVPWEPTWPRNALTHSYFCGLLRRNWRDWRLDKGYTFLIYARGQEGQKGALMGGIALNDVQRGIGQKATLGYWIGQPYAAQGFMTEAGNLVCAFAFNILQLHRIEASCIPHNEPSKALLKRLGFEQEGYAKSYLQINGQWQDHILWGKAGPRLTPAQ